MENLKMRSRMLLGELVAAIEPPGYLDHQVSSPNLHCFLSYLRQRRDNRGEAKREEKEEAEKPASSLKVFKTNQLIIN